MVCDPASVATSIIISSVCCAWQEYSEKGRRDNIRQDMREEYWYHRITEQELFEARHQELILLQSTTNSQCSSTNSNVPHQSKGNLVSYTRIVNNSNNMNASKHSSWSVGSKPITSSTATRSVTRNCSTRKRCQNIRMSKSWSLASEELLNTSRKTSLLDFDDDDEDENKVSDDDDDGSMETVSL
jgi:hypothetical protein